VNKVIAALLIRVTTRAL